MSEEKELFEKIYENLEEVPWNFEKPHDEFIGLIESGKIKPCKALDIGCGTGSYSIYLASKGFDVAGIDTSENAIKIAKTKAAEAGVSCIFLKMDWEDLDKLKEKFDFIFDWRFFQEIIEKERRKKYVELVKKLLNNGGKYLSVSHSEKTRLWGKGKIRTPPIGTTLYFASMEELEVLFRHSFKILEKKEIKLLSRGSGWVAANYLFMEKSSV
ncbi:MAG: methyltransferase domain-containing protein [Candidatus Aenigmarchaeota archaeon]|nr:methyltransferase domain-containing protein [Candidatus Aenigmarchaeota archaeon]